MVGLVALSKALREYIDQPFHGLPVELAARLGGPAVAPIWNQLFPRQRYRAAIMADRVGDFIDHLRYEFREQQIKRFEQRQRATRKWINFAEIADTCAGSIQPDQKKRQAAFDRLAQSLVDGEFDENGESMVLRLDPYFGAQRWTIKPLRYVLGPGYDDKRSDELADNLPNCWIPRRVFERWLNRYGLRRLLDRFQPFRGLANSTSVESEISTDAPIAIRDPATLAQVEAKPSKQYQRDGAKAALKCTYSNGIPDNLSPAQALKAIDPKGTKFKRDTVRRALIDLRRNQRK